MRTRLKNELIKHWHDGINLTNNAFIENYEDIVNRLKSGFDPGPINIHIINYEFDKLFLITLEFNDNYPFKPPTVMVNTTYNYKRLLGTIDNALVKKTLGLDCACCNSILCKWIPSYNITNIIDEISLNLHLKLRSSSINVAHLFTMNVFGHYLPIEEFL